MALQRALPSDTSPLLSPHEAVDAGGDWVAAHAAARTLLSERHYVQYHPALARLLEGVKPALMLGHALYWTQHWLQGRTARREAGLAREGWFWKTAQEWREATGLTPREQESARQLLRDAGVWEEALLSNGHGARLHFRVDLQALAQQLLAGSPEGSTSGAATSVASAEGEAEPLDRFQQSSIAIARMTRLLAAPVVYYRSLADISGGPTSGLLLSWLLARMGEAMAQQQASQDGFFYFDAAHAQHSLCMGAKALRNARDSLERIGLVSVGYAAERQGRLMLRVNLMALSACLSGQKQPIKRRKVGAASSGASSISADSSVHTRAAPGARLEKVLVQGNLAYQEAPGRQPVELDRDRAEVVGQRDNVTQITRLMFGPGRRAKPRQELQLRAQLDGVGLPFCRNGPPLEDLSVCRFVEKGGAFLSKPYTKEINIKEPPPTVGARLREATATPTARRRRVEEFAGNEASKAAQLPKQEAAGTRTEVPASSVLISSTGGSLVLPKRLEPGLHTAALNIVSQAPMDMRQGILDELAGAMVGQHRKGIENPLGWLHTLVAKAQGGTLVLTVAHSVAAAREAAARHAEASSARGVEQRQAVQAGPAELSPEAQQARARLKEMAKKLRLGIGGLDAG